MLNELICQICDGPSFALDVLDFNRSCEAVRKGEYRPLSGIPVYYYMCKNCGFCFAPEFSKWDLNDFSEKIYNDNYIEVDPEHEKDRPEMIAQSLIKAFSGKENDIKHLDYGGGNGLLSYLLAKSGWDTLSYDPFFDKEVALNTLGQFNLITAYEVFEHVPDINNLITQLDALLSDEGIILFSTLLSDGNIRENQRLSWWYVSPRNGHISIFSKKSLNILAAKYNFHCGNISTAYHIFFRKIPHWAAHIFRQQ